MVSLVEPVSELALAERDLDALLELSESLGDTADIEGALQRIAELLAAVLASDRCSVILLDEEAGNGIIVAASDDRALEDLSIDVAVYPEIQAVVQSGQPLMIDDVHRAPLFDSVREKIRDKPVGSTILFPVRVDQAVQAVLHLRTKGRRVRALTRQELRFGRIVANATGIALRNARLYETVRDRSERRLSERIRVERRLRQIEKYQRFFDFAGDGLMIVDGRGRILFANRASRTLLGFGEPVITRITLGDIVEEHGRAALEAILEGVRAGAYQRDVDLPVLRASGEVAILSLTTAALEEPTRTADLLLGPEGSGASVPAEDAREATAIVSFRDVTQTREIEDELRRTKDFLSNLIASSADAIVAADMQGEILIFNDAAEKITGFDAADAIGQNVTMMYPPGVAQEIMNELRAAEHGGSGKLEERRQTLRTRDGQHVPVNLAAAIVYDQGVEVATVGIFSDLRERLRMEEELQDAQRKLEVSERQRVVVQLAGAAAHELNQPLTSIIGAVELLQRRLPPDVPHLGTILREAERMAEIVRKLGQIARYETKPYLGGTAILDLDAASEDGEER